MQNPNVFILGDLHFQALGDRIIVREDSFKSGYECEGCGGTGTIKCSNCDGHGTYMRESTVGNVDIRCSECNGKGEINCHMCDGKGALIVVPETTQRRPTTGVVVSVGPGKYDANGNLIPMMLSVGQSVMYSNFAGYVVDLERSGEKVVLRLLHESEILCLLEGQLELRTLKGKTELASFSS